jgi:hypothetical protein
MLVNLFVLANALGWLGLDLFGKLLVKAFLQIIKQEYCNDGY